MFNHFTLTENSIQMVKGLVSVNFHEVPSYKLSCVNLTTCLENFEEL
jgi:hypothetical protein